MNTKQRLIILSAAAAITGSASAVAVNAASTSIPDGHSPALAPDSTLTPIGTISLDEVEVISTVKESTRMRQLPAAVTMVSQRQLEAAHATSLKGVSDLVPNFFMPDYGSRITSAIYIRGIGSRINTPAVGLYVDNVPYIDKSAFDFNFFDIERVDVLRGPQGTLYGRNAMGGIVRVYTKNPFAYNGCDVKLGYASGDNHRNLSVTKYHRFSDRFALSGGAYYEGGDGFFKNDVTGHNADHIEAGGARVRGIWRPNHRLNIDFSASYDNNDEGGYPYYFCGSLRDPNFDADHIGHISNNRESTYRRNLLNAGVNVEYQTPKYTLNSITGYQFLRDKTFLDQDFLPQDFFSLEQRQRINTWSEELTLKNSAPSRWHRLSGASVFYQTLHTTGPVTFYDDGLRWLESSINSVMPAIDRIPMLQRMGFTGMQANFRGDELLMAGTYDTPTLNLALFHQSTVDVTRRLSLTAGLRLDYERMLMDYDSPADVAYGFSMPNAANDRMSVDLQQLESHIGYFGHMNDDHLRLLPKFAVKYDVGASSSAPDADGLRGNVYASASMGQRSGGYNLQMFSDLQQGQLRADMMQGIQQGVGDYLDLLAANPNIGMPPAIPDPDNPGSRISISEYVCRIMARSIPEFEIPTVDQIVYRPEYSWNYEVGTHLNLPKQGLQLDAAAFLIDTRDQQIARFAPSGLGRMMVNAGRSRSCGAELTALWRPDAHWTLSGNYGFTHARFTDYDAGEGIDYTDNYVPFVPRHTVHLDAAYTWFLPACPWAKGLTLGADYSGVGSIYWTEDNSVSQPFYSLLGARLMLDTKWASFHLWCKNLTDARYNTFYFESVGRGFEQHGKPLQVGFDVKFSF